jgi:hypothetical protein
LSIRSDLLPRSRSPGRSHRPIPSKRRICKFCARLGPKSLHYQGIKIEDEGCGDFEVEIDGADTQTPRTCFAAAAAKSGFQITFEQRGEPLQPGPNEVVGVFASKTTLAAANALAWKLAPLGFRYIDIVASRGRWLVVMPQVPVRNALSIAKEVAKAGYRIQFRSASK